MASKTAPGAPSPITSGIYTFRFVLAWAIVFVLLGLANRTRIGHTLIYYALALSLLFLVVTHYRWFANALEPVTGVQLANTAPATAG